MNGIFNELIFYICTTVDINSLVKLKPTFFEILTIGYTNWQQLFLEIVGESFLLLVSIINT